MLILDYLTKHLEKCTSALILDRLACMALQEHFANNFQKNAAVSEARQHQDYSIRGQQPFVSAETLHWMDTQRHSSQKAEDMKYCFRKLSLILDFLSPACRNANKNIGSHTDF